VLARRGIGHSALTELLWYAECPSHKLLPDTVQTALIGGCMGPLRMLLSWLGLGQELARGLRDFRDNEARRQARKLAWKRTRFLNSPN